jgi:hypothetical protein
MSDHATLYHTGGLPLDHVRYVVFRKGPADSGQTNWWLKWDYYLRQLDAQWIELLDRSRKPTSFPSSAEFIRASVNQPILRLRQCSLLLQTASLVRPSTSGDFADYEHCFLWEESPGCKFTTSRSESTVVKFKLQNQVLPEIAFEFFEQDACSKFMELLQTSACKPFEPEEEHELEWHSDDEDTS